MLTASKIVGFLHTTDHEKSRAFSATTCESLGTGFSKPNRVHSSLRA
jgi:hypothetical protein